MAQRFFEGTLHASLYAKYRPIPPPQLIQRVISFLKEKYTGPLDLAVDVGCGSGQSTQLIAPYFKRVIGTDVSPAQIDNAEKENKLGNVQFDVCPAETISSPDRSVQLISASQAAHWFDLPTFYKECRRVLSLNGALALYGYQLPSFHWSKDTSKNTLLYEAMMNFYRGDLKGCWQADRAHVDNRYQDFVIPYADFIRDESFYHDMETQVSDLINYFSTWSGYQKYCKIHGDDKGRLLLVNLQNRMIKILEVDTDPSSIVITKRTSFFLLMARNSL